jgi:hypothetical protein
MKPQTSDLIDPRHGLGKLVSWFQATQLVIDFEVAIKIADGRTRTGTGRLSPTDFKSVASAISPHRRCRYDCMNFRRATKRKSSSKKNGDAKLLLRRISRTSLGQLRSSDREPDHGAFLFDEQAIHADFEGHNSGRA